MGLVTTASRCSEQSTVIERSMGVELRQVSYRSERNIRCGVGNDAFPFNPTHRGGLRYIAVDFLYESG